MTQSVKSLAAAARALPPEQQADLIDELVTGLSEADGGWDAAWSAEADIRWRAFVASKRAGHASDDVLADIARHLSKKRSSR